jgi:transcriptional regulator with XRE-family HTH domain
MRPGSPGSFGAQLKALREAAGYTQEELATIVAFQFMASARWNAGNDGGLMSRPCAHCSRLLT